MRKDVKIKIFIVLVLTFLSFSTFPVVAKKTFEDANTALDTVVQKTGIQKTDILSIFGKTVEMAFMVIGTLFFGLMVYSGLLWMTAHGNDEQITKARNTIIAAGIGVVVLIGSYAGTLFVQTRIIEGQSGVPIPLSPDTQGNEPLGCCYDWVAAQDTVNMIVVDLERPALVVAWRITSYSDCAYWGSNDGNGDFHSGPEGHGNWLWTEGVSAAQCQEELPAAL